MRATAGAYDSSPGSASAAALAWRYETAAARSAQSPPPLGRPGLRGRGQVRSGAHAGHRGGGRADSTRAPRRARPWDRPTVRGARHRHPGRVRARQPRHARKLGAPDRRVRDPVPGDSLQPALSLAQCGAARRAGVLAVAARGRSDRVDRGARPRAPRPDRVGARLRTPGAPVALMPASASRNEEREIAYVAPTQPIVVSAPNAQVAT